MQNLSKKIVLLVLFSTTVYSCNKYGDPGSQSISELSADSAYAANEEVSSAASQEVAGKKFVRTADVSMDVADVYEATIALEKQLQQLGGFVTESRLQSNVVSEETFETSDTDATLVRKFQADNNMQVRVPTQKLGDFLTFINSQKVFLNSRIIIAKDVTAHAKIAEMEAEKIRKTAEVIAKMKNTGEKVEKTENNLTEGQVNKIENIALADHLKYATVDIYIREPKLRVAEIAVINTKNIDNKYKFTFFYDAKNAFVEGFYLIQKVLIGMITIWPLLLIAAVIFYLFRKRKPLISRSETE